MPGTTDTVKAMLTPGEFVIRKEAVDMIGVPILEKLNDMPEAGGHSEIDRLIAQATLKNMTGMYGGGMVNAKQYMGGGKVDMYGHGGKVKNQMMMGYEHGGEAHGNLKPIPDDNPGLAKLPEKVRNKMGYMQEGGEVEDSLMGMMYGGKAKKKKKYGYQEGGSVSPEMYTSMIRKLIGKLGGEEPEGMYTPEGGLTKKGYAKMLGADPESISIDTLSFKNPANYMFKVSGKGVQSGADVGGTTQSRGVLPLKGNILDPLMREKMDDPFERMDIEMLFREIKPQGYQEGGAVQDSSMMMQANPFIPFDQRPPSSGEMMSPIPSGMEQGDMMRIIRDEREVLDMQDVELLRKKAQNALTRFQLDSLMEKATLDSLINQGSGDAMRIERSPNEPFFFPNTPAQENFMQKYKEEMIDPTYFPEGN